MTTNTEQYENAHGKRPSGKGQWVLELLGTDGNGRYTSETYSVSGTLAQARKEAVSQFKAEVGGVKKVVEVTVLP